MLGFTRLGRALRIVVGVTVATGAMQIGTIASAAADDSPAAGETSRIIVAYRQGRAQTMRTALHAHGLDSEPSALPGLDVVELPPGQDAADAAAAASDLPGVRYAEPDHIYELTASTNDPMYDELWGLSADKPAGIDAGIRANQAWNTTTGSASVVVAVVDSGSDMDHPDLVPNLWKNPGEVAGNGTDDDRNGLVDDVYGWDFAADDADPEDSMGHGTHVAGTIGARGNNGIGVTGVNWQVSLMTLRVIGDLGYAYASDIALAFRYAAAQGAQVVNASLSGPSHSQTMADALAASPQTLFVVAAGNEGKDNDAAPAYPCNYTAANLVCVGATDQWGDRVGFSNFGATSVDLAAPGKSILSTWPGGDYAEMWGTSMASPHVAGGAGLLLAARPGTSPTELKSALIAGVDPVTMASVSGGRLNMIKALNALGVATGGGDGGGGGGDDQPPPPPEDRGPMYPSGGEWVGRTPTLGWDPTAAASVTAYRLLIDGVVERDWLDPSVTQVRPMFPLSPGAHTWSVVAIDAAGVETTLGEAEIRVDTTKPSRPKISGPRRKVRTRPAFPVRWRARDAGSGIEEYEVRFRKGRAGRGLGGFRSWDRSTTRSSARFSGRPGTTYCFSVRATDGVGNESRWSAPRCTLVR